MTKRQHRDQGMIELGLRASNDLLTCTMAAL